MVPDIGSTLTGDAGLMSDYTSIRLSSTYRYNVYHFNIASLGPQLSKFLAKSQTITPFQSRPLVRTQPTVTNLLTGDTTLSFDTTPTSPRKLNWLF